MYDCDRTILDENSKRWNKDEILQIINSTEDLVVKKGKIKVEPTFHYILSMAFGSAIMTIREIIVLLYNGYPDGAMALARNLYETLVIQSYIDAHKDDLMLIEKYCDSANMQSLHDHIDFMNFILPSTSDGPIKGKIDVQVKQLESQLNEYYEKYKPLKPSTRSQFWWTGIERSSFNKLHKSTKWYRTLLKTWYDISCYRVHAGMINSYAKFGVDSKENVILTSSSTEGYEIPLHFAFASYISIFDLISTTLNIEDHALTDKIETQFKIIDNAAKEKLF